MDGLTSFAASISLDAGHLLLICIVMVALLFALLVGIIVLLIKIPQRNEEIAIRSRDAWRQDMGVAASQSQELLAALIRPEFVNTQLQLERAMQDFGRTHRDEIALAIQSVRENIGQSFANSDSRMQGFTAEQNRRIEALTQTLSNAITELNQRVDTNLKEMNRDNEAKLEKIRETVEEKLQSTLTAKVGESFAQVSQQLNRVYQGLGEMKELASDVGSLKRVLVNVKSRGTLGEVQLEALLSEYFTPRQYVKNAHTLPSQPAKVVEFAVKLPGRDSEECLLPIDSKFPIEDYQRLQDAAELGDKLLVKKAREQLQMRLKEEAKSIAQYINPPVTTDFAILFLPSEGLYAEALSLEGLSQTLYTQYRVYLMGPSTLASALCAYRAGFQTLAIERKSSEIRQMLSVIRVEFNKFHDVLSKLKGQAETVVRTVEQVETRSRQMNRKLANVADEDEQKLISSSNRNLIEL